MKIKLSEATDIQIDWLVAKAAGKSNDCEIHAGNVWYGRVTSGFIQYHPSTDWAQGGPIIEREGINISIQNDDHGNTYSGKARWWAQMDCRVHTAYGPTPLIAAMRCYVASKLGDEVEVPDEI